jgi:hypothetical protein
LQATQSLAISASPSVGRKVLLRHLLRHRSRVLCINLSFCLARRNLSYQFHENILDERSIVENEKKTGPKRNLGAFLGSRYKRTGDVTDLEEAIQVARQAVVSSPEDHSDLARSLNNRGNSLGTRYERTGDMTDLEVAIQVARQVVTEVFHGYITATQPPSPFSTTLST